MNDVTKILSAIDHGDQEAADQLLPLVYQELRKLAAAKLAKEKPGQTLQPTMLVHEAYIRLVDRDQSQHWNGRGHFFAAAAEAMRRILIENARRKQSQKRTGVIEHADVDQIAATPASRYQLQGEIARGGMGGDPL
jgi:RNA polymerase sigma factor (TIGR02999 family)